MDNVRLLAKRLVEGSGFKPGQRVIVTNPKSPYNYEETGDSYKIRYFFIVPGSGQTWYRLDPQEDSGRIIDAPENDISHLDSYPDDNDGSQAGPVDLGRTLTHNDVLDIYAAAKHERDPDKKESLIKQAKAAALELESMSRVLISTLLEG